MFQKIEKFVFLALIFSIPFQKRTFLFGTDPGLANFNEWVSGFFYFTDFLILVLAIFTAVKVFRFSEQLKKPLHPAGWRGFGIVGPLLLFLGISFISLFQADLIGVGVYRFMKLAEFIFLFFYVVGRIRHVGLVSTLRAFVASGVFQSIIAILQFAKQSSLGLEIFHESTLAIHMKGVAHIASDGLFLIRAYGTFPSPNILAGFLGLCLLFLFYLFVTDSHTRTNGASRFCSAQGGYAISIFLLTFGFILTFSRGTIIFFVFAIALFFAGMFLLRQFQEYKKEAKLLLVLVTAFWSLVVALAWPEFSSRFLGSSFDEPAIQERLFFNEVGLSTMKHDYMQALFGVGIGNFVHNFTQSMPGLPEHLYQPVHNIFILIASETGTLGFFAFVLLIALLFQRLILRLASALDTTRIRKVSIQDACYSKHLVYYTLAAVFCFVVLIGMYDHYFWTIQQGSLMFWITLGLIANKINGQV